MNDFVTKSEITNLLILQTQRTIISNIHSPKKMTVIVDETCASVFLSVILVGSTILVMNFSYLLGMLIEELIFITYELYEVNYG